VPLFAPETIAGFDDIKVISNTKKFSDYLVTPIPTFHSVKVKSQGYLIEKEGSKIFYSGDLFGIEKRNFSKMKNLNLIITEASFIRKSGMVRRDEKGNFYGHAGVPNLVEIFKHLTNKILLVHFGTWFFKDTLLAKKKLENLAKVNGVNILVGHDGFEMVI